MRPLAAKIELTRRKMHVESHCARVNLVPLLTLFHTAALLIGFSVARVEAYEYEVEGTLQVNRPFVKGVSSKAPHSFKVYVRDCQWLIHLSTEGEMSKYLEAAFDGQTMYKSGLLDEEIIRKLRPIGTDTNSISAQAPPKLDMWGGSVSSEMVPAFGHNPEIPVIWLALASSCYLRTADDRLIPPYSADIVRIPLHANLIRSSGYMGLPERIVFMDGGFDSRFGQLKRRSPPYDEGFTNAIYSVEGVVAIGSKSLPGTFHLSTFRPAPSKGNKAIELDSRYDGTVVRATPACSLTSFAPRILSEGRVADARFASASNAVNRSFTYRTSRWLNKAEVEMLPGFDRYQQLVTAARGQLPVAVVKSGAASATSRWRRSMLIALIALNSLIVLFFWSRSAKRNPN